MTVYGGPDIVTDGLVLHLDAANRKSYPGSGTTWYDLSGNDNHATSVSWASSYLSDNGGVINYPTQSNTLTTSKTASELGVSDNNGFTISVFFNKKSNPPASTSQGYIGFNNIKIWSTTYYYIRFTATNGTQYSPGWTDVTATSLEDQWIELCFSWTSNYFLMYRNGQVIKTQILNAYLESIQSDYLRIGHGLGYYNFHGKMSNVRMYNRVLTPYEVSQNYNALKGRFGL